MIRFEGIQTFSHPVSVTSKFLSDAGWLAASLPDTEVIQTAPDKSSWKVRPKFAFMSGTLDTHAEVTERVEGVSAKYVIVSRGVGSSSTVHAELFFTASDSGTDVKWSAEVKELGGLLKLVPKTLFQGAMHKVIEDVWPAIHQKMKSSSA